VHGSRYGSNLSRKVSEKKDILELLRKQLASRAKKKQYGYIVLSSATDPYIGFEEKEILTKQILEIILEFNFPIHIITRSSLVNRDINILNKIKKKAILPPDLASKSLPGTLITFSFSTLDDDVASKFEPGATPPSERLKSLKYFSENGFNAGVALMPLIPFISDTKEKLNESYEVLKTHGAQYIMPASMSLNAGDEDGNMSRLFIHFSRHYPELVENYSRLYELGEIISYKHKLSQMLRNLNIKHNIPNRISQ